MSAAEFIALMSVPPTPEQRENAKQITRVGKVRVRRNEATQD